MSKKVDIVPITGKLELIDLSILHVRWIPQARLERFWHGEDLMALTTSPHVELIRMYAQGYGMAALMKTRYADERRSRRAMGMERWTEAYIHDHIMHRIKIYSSLKKHGFIPGDRPIEVLREPFWNTRYNLKDDRIKGAEIWNGAGRCAAAIVLGWKTIPGLWVKDAMPGTMKCKKIDGKYKNGDV